MRKVRGFLLCALALMGSSALEATTINGRVLSAGDRPVEHARVEVGGGEQVVFSDREGYFELTRTEVPATLVIGHPRFEALALQVDESSGDLRVVLTPKQEVYEAIAVSANRGQENFAPVSVAASVIVPAESSAPATSVTELLAETAAVAENGQGGLFQTYSVRGISRQRVLTLVTGMRIVGERRAGVSASFVDPLLLGSVDVVRGPSSTYYGSGALGGVVQLFPRHFDGVSVAAGVESQGGESHLLVASGSETTSWGLAFRDAGKAKTPDGDTLDSGFSQLSGSFRKSWKRAGLDFDLGLLGSAGRDIGKASTDWPERVTTYPEERHLIARLGISRPAVWELMVALHPNRLDTEVVESRLQRTEVANQAFDLAVGWQRRLQTSRIGSLRMGVDYFGRRGVDARETLYNVSGAARQLQLVKQTLDNGSEDELGLFGAWEWNWGQSVTVAGGRLAWQRQKNATSASAEDTAATAFVGVVLPIGAGFEVVANAGTGLRFPSLSERFFIGTTGRGLVVGNPDLEPESSFNLDAGLRFYGERLFVTAYVFSNRIDDYIERTEIGSDLFTFGNLSSGKIEGVEMEGFVNLDTGWSLTFGGHVLEGRDPDGGGLADVPADRLFLGTQLEHGRWAWRLRWEARAAKNDPGSGEKAISAANLVSSAADYELRPGLSLQVALRNALDESYFNSADRKVPLAPGRSVSFGLRWTPPRE